MPFAEATAYIEADKDDRKLAYAVDHAAHVTSISRAKLYGMIATGELRAIRIGSRRLIPATEIQRLLGLHAGAE